MATTPLRAVRNHYQSNWELYDSTIKFVQKNGESDIVIQENALRIHQIESGTTWHEDYDRKDIPGLVEGMRRLGCKEPEKLIKDIEPMFEREFVAPVGREVDRW